MAFRHRHVELCGEVIAQRNQKGYAWRILHLLREKNQRGRFVRMGSGALAAKLERDLIPNTLSQSIKVLRDRTAHVLRDRLDLACGPFDVIDNRGKGYHRRDWITVEVYDEAGILASGTRSLATGNAPEGGDDAASDRFSERQRWVPAQLAGGGKLPRRDVEKQSGISTRTAKRELGELVNAGRIKYHGADRPGGYRMA